LPARWASRIARVDRSEDLDDGTIGAIRRAWLDHLVIFFHQQHLSAERFLGFARSFGDVVEYPLVKGIDGFPEITSVVKLEHERVNFGGLWHSGTTFLGYPPMGTMLLAPEVPPFGGDTQFTNMYLAYETLSAGMRRLRDGVVAITGHVDVRQNHDRGGVDPLAQSLQRRFARRRVRMQLVRHQ
jgi:taurine dioxygenase